MSRKIKNTLFITLNLLTILTFNTLLFSCDELSRSTISKNNIQIEITSEPKFFSAIKETLDSFDKGVFVSVDYVESDDQRNSNSKSNKNQAISELDFDEDVQEYKTTYDSESDYEKYENLNDYDQEYYDAESHMKEDYQDAIFNSENKEFLEAESTQENLELLQLQKEIASYNPYDKTEEELTSKVNQLSALLKKLKKELNEEADLKGTEKYGVAEHLSSSAQEDLDQREYYDEEDQNAVLKEYVFSSMGEINPEKLGDCEKRNIKRLSLLTMFHMETLVKFNLNSAL